MPYDDGESIANNVWNPINHIIGVEKIVSSVIHLWLTIQTPFAPIVHPKMNSGKEFPSAII
jgi:hypothetical protein